jgi:hypothetical protein
MIIKLSKDCRIEGSDGLQFVVQVREQITDKAVGGKVSEHAGELSGWRNRGYHGTLPQALNGVLKRTLVTGKQEVSVKQLIAYLDLVTQRLVRASEGVTSARAAAEMEGSVDPEEFDALFAEVG